MKGRPARAMLPVMDPVALVFYALVCALLARFVPDGMPAGGRLALGAAVGVAAAAALPVLRSAAGL